MSDHTLIDAGFTKFQTERPEDLKAYIEACNA